MVTHRHRTFLIWQLYVSCLVSGFGVLTYYGLPQLALRYDHSYISYVLFGLFVIALIFSGRQAWIVSRETIIADETTDWLDHQPLTHALVKPDHVVLANETATYQPSASITADHIRMLLVRRASGDGTLNQDNLLVDTADRLYGHDISSFISARIVWIGILATIMGVIMAFWPMIDGASLDLMKTHLSKFFGGIAVAFIPTALSFGFKILLDCSEGIIEAGIKTLLGKIVHFTRLDILPFLHQKPNCITVTR